MSDENNSVSVFRRMADMLHVSLETFVLIVSVIFVVGASLLFLSEMISTNGAKDVYMNWDDITYISEYYDEKRNEEVVSITIESIQGMPKGMVISRNELHSSKACPIVMSDSVVVPTMDGQTLILPYHFDSVYGYVKQYHKMLQEE